MLREVRIKKVLLFCVILIAFSLSIPTCCAALTPEIVATVTETEDMIILRISLVGEADLCGLCLDISYPEEYLFATSCERGDAMENLNFNSSIAHGRVRLLFWGDENSRGEGRIATLCFLRTDDRINGELKFSLSLPTQSSAIRFDGDKIVPVSLSLVGATLDGTPQSSEQEIPSAENTETPGLSVSTEIFSDMPVEANTEASTSPKGEESPTGAQAQNNYGKKLRRICLAAVTACSVLDGALVLPYLFSDIFRKGYF